MSGNQVWLQLPDGTLYSWNKPVLTIHNLIVGRIWLEWHGDIKVKDRTTGTIACIATLKPFSHL